MDFNQIYQDLVKLNVGQVIRDEPMYKHTTLRVGGPCAIFINVNTQDGLIAALKYVNKHHIKSMVIGKGSNLLFSDGPYQGVIITLAEGFNYTHYNGCTVTAGAGVSMIKLAYQAANAGLSGFEFMSGIPGTIGGGVYMNAGAYKYDMASVVRSVKILNEKYQVITLTNEQMEFGYRKSLLMDQPRWVVLEVVFELSPSNPEFINEVIDKRKEKRMTSQPWNKPSAGSIFQNPEAAPAWKLIEDCDLRGREIGGAQVSLKHCNFIVNNGYASAKDIYDLIELVKEEVKKQHNIELHQEVKYVNWE